MAASGVLTLALSRLPLGQAASAASGAMSVWLAPALLMLPGESPGANDFTITAITLRGGHRRRHHSAPAVARARGRARHRRHVHSLLQWELPSNSGHSEAHHIFLDPSRVSGDRYRRLELRSIGAANSMRTRRRCGWRRR